MLCLPALRLAAVKVLEGMVAADGETQKIRVVVVVDVEARALIAQLHLARDRPSPVAMGVVFPSLGHKGKATVAISTATDVPDGP